MAISEEDFRALRALFREEMNALFRADLQPFQAEVSRRFDEIATQMDGLYNQNESRQEEYLLIREQLGRVEERAHALEKKCA